jgi:hypothetical protein
MKKVRWLVIPLVLGMLLTSMNVALAQTVDTTPPAPTQDPVTLPTTAPTPINNINPIVKLLAQFFSFLFTPVATDNPAFTDATATDVSSTDVTTPELTATPVPLTPEEQVAAYHAEDLGFGVLVKLFSIASAAQAQCQLDGTQCDVTVDSLIAQVQSGVGIGQIEKQFGKPEFLGIGQVRKANAEQNGNSNGKGKGHNK